MVGPELKRIALKWVARLALLVFVTTAGGFLPASAHHDEPILQGTMRDNFILSQPRKPAPSTSFSRLDGRISKLGDLHGHTVLLNFWATWCAPCVREMPSLDRLHSKLEERGLVVLAISSDRGGSQTVLPFVAKHQLNNMEIGLDPRGELSRDFVIPGLPTTYLIDAEGQIVGAMAGPAEWDEGDALTLVESVLPHDPSEDVEIDSADCGCRTGKIMAARKKREALKLEALEVDEMLDELNAEAAEGAEGASVSE